MDHRRKINMNLCHRTSQLWLLLCCIAVAPALAQTLPELVEPVLGQPGKDVVWVPTQMSTVEKMLDLARVTPQDFVVDLGSGDGRNVIAAAKRGARALGVEWDANLVELSKRAASAEGVADKAIFVQGDMYEADVSKATVFALYLLPEIMKKLAPKFLALKPGTRIVSNTFAIEGWRPEETDKGPGECTSWCTVLLYVVPANVGGSWRLGQSELALVQNAQTVSGSLNSDAGTVPIANGRLRGDQITFTAAGVDYVGRVNGDAITGEMKGGNAGAWSATRVRR
jgi:SAM-dependent methyltransferase